MTRTPSPRRRDEVAGLRVVGERFELKEARFRRWLKRKPAGA